MTDLGSSLITTVNNTSGYFSSTDKDGWVFDIFGDLMTYSDDTLVSAITKIDESTPSETSEE